MSENQSTVRVHVNIELSAASLQAVVANCKIMARKDEHGPHRLDTADALSALISRFLQENGFEAFAQDMNNY